MAPKSCPTYRWGATMAWCILLGILPSHLYAETPIQALQETLDRFQRILHDAALGEDSREEQVLETILARFDIWEISKRILGPYWHQHPEQQDAFVAEFTAFMKKIFLKHFDQIRSLKVTCREETIQGPMAKVVTNLSTAKEELTINFRMHQHDEGWKIYDVVLGDGSFSLLKSYRTQLQWILQSASFEQLLDLLAEKNGRGLTK